MLTELEATDATAETESSLTLTQNTNSQGRRRMASPKQGGSHLSVCSEMTRCILHVNAAPLLTSSIHAEICVLRAGVSLACMLGHSNCNTRNSLRSDDGQAPTVSQLPAILTD